MRKSLTFVSKASAMSGNESLKTSQLKNCSLTSGQPGELTTTSTSTPKKTSVLTAAMAALRAPRRTRRGSASSGLALLEDRSARLVESHSVWICSSVPSAFSAASASLTQSPSVLPFWKSIPKCSWVPVERELADDLAVLDLFAPTRKNAVGRSTTSPSICFALSAATASFDVSYTRGPSVRLDRVVDVPELVVPICAPSCVRLRSASVFASAIGVPFSPTSAWLTS